MNISLLTLALLSLTASTAYAWQGTPYLGFGMGLYQADYHETGSNVSASLGGRDHKTQAALIAGYGVHFDDSNLGLAAELNWHNGYGELEDYRIGASTAKRQLTSARSLSILPSIAINDNSNIYLRLGKGSIGFEVVSTGGTLKSTDLNSNIVGIGYSHQFNEHFAWRVEYQHLDSETNTSLFTGVGINVAATGLQADLLYRF